MKAYPGWNPAMLSSPLSRDTHAGMGFRLALRRIALIVEALTGILVTVAAVIIALIPACTGQTAPVGGRGGIECVTTLGRGSWVLFPVAAVSLGVAAVAVRELVVMSRRTDSLALAAQIPVIAAAIFVLGFYHVNLARSPVWGAIALALCAAIILLTSSRPAGKY
jgi:hypothetical protein